MKLQTILVPTDFSPDADRALEVAVDLARDTKGKILLLHAYMVDFPLAGAAYGGAVMLPEGFYTAYREQAVEQVEKKAKEVADRAGIEIEALTIEKPAWQGIVDEAERLAVDLIVIGTRGLTGLKHVTLGSTAERVVRHARCPVLTVKSD